MSSIFLTSFCDSSHGPKCTTRVHPAETLYSKFSHHNLLTKSALYRIFHDWEDHYAIIDLRFSVFDLWSGNRKSAVENRK